MSSTVQPSWSQVGQHAVFPQATRDEVARFEFLARLNVHLSQAVLPGVKLATETCVKPAFEAERGRAPAERHEVHKTMQQDLHYPLWNALRRNTMEQRQRAGRSVVFRQLAALREADLDALLTQSGFPSGAYFETTMKAKTDRRLFPAPSGSESGQEDYGCSPSWTAFGAAKP